MDVHGDGRGARRERVGEQLQRERGERAGAGRGGREPSAGGDPAGVQRGALQRQDHSGAEQHDHRL